MEWFGQSYAKFVAAILMVGIVGAAVLGYIFYSGINKQKQGVGVATPTGLQSSILSPTPEPVSRLVAIEVVSELDEVPLAGGVNNAVLGKWLQTISGSSGSYRFKELGGTNWFTPATVNIVLSDITS